MIVRNVIYEIVRDNAYGKDVMIGKRTFQKYLKLANALF